MTGGSGQTPTSPAPNAEIYDPATGMFTAVAAYAERSRGLLTTNLLADGKVLITGCKSDCGDDADLVQLYEPATGTFSLTAAISRRRSAPRPDPARHVLSQTSGLQNWRSDKEPWSLGSHR